jgi:hypothetical protein
MGQNTMKFQRTNFRKMERGQSLLELALGLVILITLLAGIVDLGRAIFTQLTMRDAVGEGVVFGVGFPTDCNQIVERVRANLENMLVSPDVEVSIKLQRNDGTMSSCYVIPFAEVYAGKRIEVSTVLQFEVTMPFIGAIIGQTIPLSAKSTGVILRPPPPD